MHTVRVALCPRASIVVHGVSSNLWLAQLSTQSVFFFVLISNEAKNEAAELEAYRNKKAEDEG